MDIRTVMNKNNEGLGYQNCDEQGVFLRADAYTFSEADGAKNDPVIIIPPFGEVNTTTPVIENVILNLGRVYPNPIVNNINIELNKTEDIQSIEVYDAFGKLCRQALQPGAIVTTFDMKGMAAGMYNVVIRTKEGVQSIKVVKP